MAEEQGIDWIKIIKLAIFGVIVFIAVILWFGDFWQVPVGTVHEINEFTVDLGPNDNRAISKYVCVDHNLESQGSKPEYIDATKYVCGIISIIMSENEKWNVEQDYASGDAIITGNLYQDGLYMNLRKVECRCYDVSEVDVQ